MFKTLKLLIVLIVLFCLNCITKEEKKTIQKKTTKTLAFDIKKVPKGMVWVKGKTFTQGAKKEILLL